jgi:hypothetical protein
LRTTPLRDEVINWQDAPERQPMKADRQVREQDAERGGPVMRPQHSTGFWPGLLAVQQGGEVPGADDGVV